MCKDAKAPNNTNVLLASIVSRIVCLPTFYLRIQRLKIYKTRILYAVLYGCETWSLILREGHRLKPTEISLLRKILGPKRREVSEDWGKLHEQNLHGVYSI